MANKLIINEEKDELLKIKKRKVEREEGNQMPYSSKRQKLSDSSPSIGRNKRLLEEQPKSDRKRKKLKLQSDSTIAEKVKISDDQRTETDIVVGQYFIAR